MTMAYRLVFSVPLRLLLILEVLSEQAVAQNRDHPRWSAERAQAWFQQQPWRKGANFVPSSASSQLEMFQAATWDERTIARELGWAMDLGFNIIRVFLHDLLWTAEDDGFLSRIDRFLTIADAAGIGTMLVLFDGCWNPAPHLGVQPEPRPRVHNSRWVQAPGAAALTNLTRHEGRLRAYVHAVVGRFANDSRVVMWDVFNEPDNGNINNYGYVGERVPSAADAKGTELRPLEKAIAARALLEKAILWVREAGPSQPLTVPVYSDATGDAAADEFRATTLNWTLGVVDVITFHGYTPISGTGGMAAWLASLKPFGRPIVCSEYMARTTGSTFDPILGFLKAQNAWAINWGFVAGRSQTIYPWNSWNKQYAAEPEPWHHDVLHADGTPYSAAEAVYIHRQNSSCCHSDSSHLPTFI